MLERRFGKFVPGFLRNRLMAVEALIERSVAEFSISLPSGSRVLDAGAGESRHRAAFGHCVYVAVDLAVGDQAWDYGDIDCVGDLAAIPLATDSFDAALNVVVLEHLPRPDLALAEIARVLKPGGKLLLVAPQQWEVHQAPHDYFRFTRYGLEELCRRAGLVLDSIEPMGGYFALLARRLMGSLNFFQGGLRWLAFPFGATAV
ncbi:MAG: class I SAM-dependent methyltransferase, partial [Acidobacteria bacterium]|nr:class I SAM-dependent methyltransferase [Acidobacteriota bacterium]